MLLSIKTKLNLSRCLGQDSLTQETASGSSKVTNEEDVFRSVKVLSIVSSGAVFAMLIIILCAVHMLCYENKKKKVRLVLLKKNRKSTPNCSEV